LSLEKANTESDKSKWVSAYEDFKKG